MSKNRSDSVKDSHELYAEDFFRSQGIDENELLKHVHPADRSEVKVALAVPASQAGEVTALRVFPVYMGKEFNKVAKASQGQRFNRSIYFEKRKRLYHYGFNIVTPAVETDNG